MKKIILFACLMLFCSVSFAVEIRELTEEEILMQGDAHFKQGCNFLKQKKYKQAYEEFSKGSDLGHAPCIYNLGWIHEYVQEYQNIDKALGCYLLARQNDLTVWRTLLRATVKYGWEGLCDAFMNCFSPDFEELHEE